MSLWEFRSARQLSSKLSCWGLGSVSLGTLPSSAFSRCREESMKETQLPSQGNGTFYRKKLNVQTLILSKGPVKQILGRTSFLKWQVKELHILPTRKSKNLKGQRRQIDSSCWIFSFHIILQHDVLSLFNIPDSMPAISCTASLLRGSVRKGRET